MRQTKFCTITKSGDLILPVPREHVEQVWIQAAPYINEAIRRSKSPSFDTDDLKELCLKDSLTLWIVARQTEIIAAILTEVIKMPKKKLLSIPWIGGKKGELRSWLKPMLTILEDYAKSFGCNAITGSERAGWCRLAGFKPMTTIFVKELA